MPETQAIAEQNVTEVPLYTPLDVARYLRVPAWVPLAVAGQRLIHPREFAERFWCGPEAFSRSAQDDDGLSWGNEKTPRISFRSLVVLFVHSPLFRSTPFWLEPPNGRPKFALPTLERAWAALRTIASEPERFTDPDLFLSRIHLDWWPNLTKEKIRKLILLHIARVEVKDGIPTKIFPFSRDPELDPPRVVEIDPEIRFGRPCVKGVPTDVVVERWRAGDSAADLAEDYGLTTDEVDEAIRYESAPYPYAAFSPLDW